MAGSSPPANAVKRKLQGFFGVIVITRNEGVRGSNPRVGLRFAGILAIASLFLATSPNTSRTP